jgi:hypothetical protein
MILSIEFISNCELSKHSSQRAGLCAGWEIEFRLLESLLIEKLKLKLSTKVEIYSSSPNKS